jgi:ABC-type multidrug transport system permease subunit
MPLISLLAMIRKDLLLFFTDRRSVITSFIVPIAIASFFGSIFSGPSRNAEPAQIAVLLADEDESPISKAIAESAAGDRNLKLSRSTAQDARDMVRRGTAPVGVIIPKGFGDGAGAALFGDGEKPSLEMVFDPSRNTELATVRGIFTQHIMEAVSREMFGGTQGRAYLGKALTQIEVSSRIEGAQKQALLQMLRSVQQYYDKPAAPAGTAPRGGLTMPYTVREEAMTAGPNAAYNGYAHSFAGMGIQFLLFAMANLGIEMLLERQRGLWKRLRSAPVSRLTLLAGKAASGTLIALMTLLVSFGFAMLVFHVRIEGSALGFLGVSIACSLMAATFGLLVASLGSTPATARGVTTLAVLMLVMLGGAWVPTFIFPAWLQTATIIVPVRWAVDGLDAMTWRGIGFAGAVMPILVQLAFAALFGAVAAARFRWEEA